MIKRNQHAEEKTGRLFGTALLWLACSSPEPFGPRVLQRAKEGGSTIAYEISSDCSDIRVLLNPIEGTIQ
jgi:hypothetical protein